MKPIRDNSQLGRNIRNRVRSSSSIPATVVDAYPGGASVRLVTNGALVRNLDVVGGTVKIGDIVKVDLTTAKPTVVVSGQNNLTTQDINDIISGKNPGSRKKVIFPPFHGAEGGGGGHVIQDEGDSLPQRKYLNFVGLQVEATDSGDADTTNVTFTGLPLAIYHNGAYLGLAQGLNFVDDDCS